MATRTLSWHECVANAGGPYSLRTGSGMLADSDYQAVLAAVHAVAVSRGPHRGADAPVWTLTVTTPAGMSTYYDEFCKCQNTDKTYVSGVPELLAKLHSVRPPGWAARPGARAAVLARVVREDAPRLLEVRPGLPPEFDEVERRPPRVRSA